MSHRPLRGAGVLATLALAACQSVPVTDSASEAAAIRGQDAAWVAAIADKNVDRIVSFYSGDAWFMPPNDEAKTGEGIRKAWTDFVALPGVRLTFTPKLIEVDRDGEMAIDVGTYDFSFDGPGGKVEDHGKYAQTWEKVDGTWKVAVDMYNSNVPLPPPTAVPGVPQVPAVPAVPKTQKKKKG
jgi:ketosteroid isomerase-like protein